MYRLAKARLHQSYTYFTWRNTRRGAGGVLDRAHADRGARVLPAQLLAEHARHPDRAPAGRRAAGLRPTARAGGHAERRTTGSTARRSSSARARRSRPGSEEYLDSEKYQLRTGTSTRSRPLANLIAPSTGSGASTRRFSSCANVCFLTPSTTSSCSLHQAARDRQDVVLTWSSTSTRTGRRRAGSTCPWTARPRPGRPFQVHDLLSGDRYALARPATGLRGARPAARAGPHPGLPRPLYRMTPVSRESGTMRRGYHRFRVKAGLCGQR